MSELQASQPEPVAECGKPGCRIYFDEHGHLPEPSDAALRLADQVIARADLHKKREGWTMGVRASIAEVLDSALSSKGVAVRDEALTSLKPWLKCDIGCDSVIEDDGVCSCGLEAACRALKGQVDAL